MVNPLRLSYRVNDLKGDLEFLKSKSLFLYKNILPKYNSQDTSLIGLNGSTKLTRGETSSVKDFYVVVSNLFNYREIFQYKPKWEPKDEAEKFNVGKLKKDLASLLQEARPDTPSINNILKVVDRYPSRDQAIFLEDRSEINLVNKFYDILWWIYLNRNMFGGK